MERGTFSIVARDRKTGAFGVASATAAQCVGAFLPFAQEGVGAIATQAWVNVNLGYQGLELIRQGLAAKTALEALLSEDKGRTRRQVVAVDCQSTFGYTGEECGEAKGHVLGEDFAVAGNILADRRVLDAMVTAHQKASGEIGHRLICALEAGQEAGGDHRGKCSAVLLVASSTPRLQDNIRVDMNDDPVVELRRIFDKCVRIQQEYGDDTDEAGELLRPRITRFHK